MSEDFLLRFLDKGLINVGGDDDKLKRIRQAVDDLSVALQETPTKAAAYALVAFDSSVPVTDPTISEVADVLRGRWETFVNTFEDVPVSVFRAMLLSALATVCQRNDAVAVAFSSCARNLLPLIPNGDESEIWLDIYNQIEALVQNHAETEWELPSAIILDKFEPEIPIQVDIEVKKKKVRDTTLVKDLRLAAGPQYIDPQRGNPVALPEGNQHWANDTGGRWVAEFADRAGSAIARAINRSVASIVVESPDLSQTIKEVAKVMSDHVAVTLSAVGSATAGLERRTQLLWWKEALFSPSARISYVKMEPLDAAVLMAFDLHQQVPMLNPSSVTAFLKQTVTSLPSLVQESRISFWDFVDHTRHADILENFRVQVRTHLSSPSGRTLILALICYPETSLQVDSNFRDYAGVEPEIKLAISEWSLWIFRELQATKALAEAASHKRSET